MEETFLTAAPTITAILTAFLAFSAVKWKEIQGQRKLEETKNLLCECLKNPITSEEHKTVVQKKLENLELLDIDHKVQQIQDLFGKKEEGISPNKTSARKGSLKEKG